MAADPPDNIKSYMKKDASGNWVYDASTADVANQLKAKDGPTFGQMAGSVGVDMGNAMTRLAGAGETAKYKPDDKAKFDKAVGQTTSADYFSKYSQKTGGAPVAAPVSQTAAAATQAPTAYTPDPGPNGSVDASGTYVMQNGKMVYQPGMKPQVAPEPPKFNPMAYDGSGAWSASPNGKVAYNDKGDPISTFETGDTDQTQVTYAPWSTGANAKMGQQVGKMSGFEDQPMPTNSGFPNAVQAGLPIGGGVGSKWQYGSQTPTMAGNAPMGDLMRSQQPAVQPPQMPQSVPPWIPSAKPFGASLGTDTSKMSGFGAPPGVQAAPEVPKAVPINGKGVAPIPVGNGIAAPVPQYPGHIEQPGPGGVVQAAPPQLTMASNAVGKGPPIKVAPMPSVTMPPSLTADGLDGPPRPIRTDSAGVLDDPPRPIRTSFDGGKKTNYGLRSDEEEKKLKDGVKSLSASAKAPVKAAPKS